MSLPAASPLRPLPPATLDRLKARLGPDGWSDDPARLAPKLVEWRGRWTGTTPVLLTPRSVEEVRAVVALCAEAGAPLTVQGGNTGLVGGQIPQGEALLSLEKLRRIRDVTPLDDCLVAEAGVPLAEVQEAAVKAERRFPLSLASEGSATIGGLISTNAGGTAVLRYGVMRDLVLGLEVVLPDGRLFAGLKRLRKDNTGYDLKQLFIGAEGTLGVVTAASLKLFPALRSRAVAFVAFASPIEAIELLAEAKAETGGAVEAFELIGRRGVDFALRNIPGVREPFPTPYPWYALIEVAGGEPGFAAPALERLLARAFESELILDAAIAQNAQQAADFWRLREEQSSAQKPEGPAWKHDVSVPVSQIADFIAAATAEAEAFYPGARVVAFGHVGDGNVHFDVIAPEGSDPAAFVARRDEGSRRIHDIVHAMNGSISAEHGLGAMKSAEALRYKTPAEIDLMRAVRGALDPGRLLNPRILF